VGPIDPLKHPDLASKVVQGEQDRKSRQTEMGWIGRIVGNATEKPGNVAWFAIAVSAIMIFALVFFAPSNTKAPLDTLYTLFGGIITLALGYLFGKNNSG
jgi:membrane protease YdiL (CAAX protease family)